jgi:hypothetical protein
MNKHKTNNEAYIYISAVGGSILSQSYSINYCNATSQAASVLFLMLKKYATAEEQHKAK